MNLLKTLLPRSYQLTATSFRHGFTLIEMLIYMGLLSIFLVVLTDMLTQTLDVRTKSTSVAYVSSDGEYIRNRLQYDIRRSSAIVTPSSLGTAGSSLQLTIGGSAYTYAVQGTNLVLTQGGNTSSLNTTETSVAGFSVTRVGNGTGKDTLEISYTISSISTLRGAAADTKAYAITVGAR